MGPGLGRPVAELAASEAGTRPAPLGEALGGAQNEAWEGTLAETRAANEPQPMPGGTGLPSLARPAVQ